MQNYKSLYAAVTMRSSLVNMSGHKQTQSHTLVQTACDLHVTSLVKLKPKFKKESHRRRTHAIKTTENVLFH